MTPIVVEPEQSQAVELNAFLDEQIYEFNKQRTGYVDGRLFQSVIRDNANAIVAAISGHTWGSCCHVVCLWVHELHRHNGLGRRLLIAVETEAISRNCNQILLYTHSFQAPGFYEAMQYVKVTTIKDYPRGHALLGYIKVLQRKPDG